MNRSLTIGSRMSFMQNITPMVRNIVAISATAGLSCFMIDFVNVIINDLYIKKGLFSFQNEYGAMAMPWNPKSSARFTEAPEMKVRPFIVAFALAAACTDPAPVAYHGLPEDLIHPKGRQVLPDTIIYHPVHVDNKGGILPWYSTNLGESYDHVLNLVWNFWKNMEVDSNGMQYYMNHQVWDPSHDKRGLGGDQIMMAMSSWDLYYNYTGDESLIENMKYMAGYYLAHSLSPPDAEWPNLHYPYNMNVESGIYDGDMIIGKGYLQPDKAGSFGYELVHLYKKTGDEKYLEAAVNIANTLAAKVQPGDNDNSPWPFRVHAETGEVGVLVDQAEY